MTTTVKMTRDGGNYWRAQAFSVIFSWGILIPVLLVLLVCILNPLWFRDRMMDWCVNAVNRISRWRNYRAYAIYLGTDPKLWHTLKDSN